MKRGKNGGDGNKSEWERQGASVYMAMCEEKESIMMKALSL